ncbi:MAG: imidazoleglycerol-phosphate dehydratase HisB [Deltaproteobacteria bacterium]|nr:imidazoleglycerol-phosphate dehydratase HisB [Deltaproteobacteria bacterium]
MKVLRKASINRKTSETNISLSLNIDGSGKYRVKTPIPFFNHMLEAFAKHGMFDLTLTAAGDVEVDDHHLVEDVGLCLGSAFKKALKDKKGIRRYGHFTLPMDEVLTTVAVDFCNRPCMVYEPKIKSGRIKNFDVQLVHEFFQAFVNEAAVNLHVHVLQSGNKHHVVESIFKSFARAVDMATSIDSRANGIPSTKGKL